MKPVWRFSSVLLALAALALGNGRASDLPAYQPGLTLALGVNVNADNPLERITLEQLDALYSDERRRGGAKPVTTWGDLGLTGEWAARPVAAHIHRLPNGVDYFIQLIVTKGADFR